VGDDYFKYRFTFSMGCPMLGMKGSYVVVKNKIEKSVGWDNELKGSIAEDAVFALLAWSKGVNFGFISGHMIEKSAFTVIDLLKQRRRCFQGLCLTATLKKIPLKYRLVLMLNLTLLITMPLLIIGGLISTILYILNPVLLPWWVNSVTFILGFAPIFSYIIGASRNFSPKNLGWLKYLVTMISMCFLWIPAGAIETVVPFYSLFTNPTAGFHLVQKEGEFLLQKQINNEDVKLAQYGTFHNSDEDI